MTYEHIKSHHQYTELRWHDADHERAKSATTGRWVKVRRRMLREIQTPESLAEAEDFVRKEHLSHLAWALSRELPYNLGVAVTNIALVGHGGDLTVVLGAVRDEIERNHHAGTQPPDEETHV